MADISFIKIYLYLSKSRKKIGLSLQYNAFNSFLYDNGVKVYQFKAKYSEIKPYPLCLVHISKDVTVNSLKKKQHKRNKQKNRLNRKLYILFLDFVLIIILLILVILWTFINIWWENTMLYKGWDAWSKSLLWWCCCY